MGGAARGGAMGTVRVGFIVPDSSIVDGNAHGARAYAAKEREAQAARLAAEGGRQAAGLAGLCVLCRAHAHDDEEVLP